MKKLLSILLLLNVIPAFGASFTEDCSVSTGVNAGWGSNWQTYNSGVLSTTGFQITSGTCNITTSFTLRTAKWNGVAIGANQYSQATMVTGTVDAGEYVTVRDSDGLNFYAAGRLNDTTIRMVKYIAGVQSTLDTQTFSIVDGDVLRLEINGSTLNFYVDGVLRMGPIVDPDIGSGQPGIRAINTATWDNIEGGDLGGGGSSVPAIYQILRQQKK